MEKQDLGIVVEQCAVQSIPPRQLKEAFANVLKAEVKRSKVLNEARSYENQVTNKASADAAIAHQPGAIRARPARQRHLQPGASSSRSCCPSTSENPDLFVQQRLTETLGRVLTNVQDKIFLAESADGKPQGIAAAVES